MSSIVEQVGRVIGGRYRLLAVVGAGASAQVFAADDTRLGRRVAVKLLHPALAGDATFLRKFQAEARLAASLNHRNVLHVYDWGDKEGVPYLVLEYLGGGSLRSLLDTGFLLSPEQAAAIGVEAAQGLAYAHRRGLVHRDIKPANLLFDDDGRLLVADFGLARALAEAAITEPLGSVIGTARYASPEQVEGRPVDDRTDVYSLALTLYESVTGRVPFAGDTTVATLMARVGAVLPPAKELGSLAPVLAQAAISEPLARLDAAAFASELEMLLQELEAPEPLPLAGTDIALPSSPRRPDRDPTERFGVASPPPVMPVAVIGEAQPTEFPLRVARPAVMETTVLPGVRRITTAGAISSAEPTPKRRKHRWLPWLLVVLVLEIGTGAGLYVSHVLPKKHVAVVHRETVPRIVGLPSVLARASLQRTGLFSELTAEQYSATVPVGEVIFQVPKPGVRLKSGSIVTMVISRGRHPTVLPKLSVGLPEAAARALIRSAHLIGHFFRHFSETLAAGEVVGWNSVSGRKVFYGEVVNVVVSKGPRPQVIPSDLNGGVVNWAQAQAALTDLHLNAVESEQYSTAIPAGYVISTKPSAGYTVSGHSTVVVVVSLGPPYVKVPPLSGDTAAVAEQTLSSLGLKWYLVGPPGANFVLTELPGAGRSVQVGTTVDVYLYG
jgi:serine/threonine protein kinase/beta-lactam-binding protein with PASTA domain